MPKRLYCDQCGSEEDADEDYDGAILCGRHRAEKNLRDLRERYRERREWVRSTWLAQLRHMRKEISRLESVVKEYDQETIEKG